MVHHDGLRALVDASSLQVRGDSPQPSVMPRAGLFIGGLSTLVTMLDSWLCGAIDVKACFTESFIRRSATPCNRPWMLANRSAALTFWGAGVARSNAADARASAVMLAIGSA